ncbi:hypothetical protein DM02DRAFT_648325 [Periconia macrospinosa]|uniref:Uncharacterized protein n=1 Tax=Periconia macrospinosa TaxID=97972 RepID=A0A2V1EDS5_9PLEO|nr:hypothetical protein DM02DRAFT_648325 [Periconia macrospinosa]
MSLEIPTVTIDDLRHFHAKHFAHAPLPELYLWGNEQWPNTEEEVQDYEDDELGYYDDGMKRTLTDEQIAMFRHTEIQTILRERRRRLEEGESLQSITSAAPPVTSEIPDLDQPIGSPAPSDESTPMSISSEDEKEPSAPTKEPEQRWTAISAKTRARNAKNRNKSRKNYRARKKEARKLKEHEMRKAKDEESDEWDPWHQANGPDNQKDETIDLDY